jgi:hypothetical protein
MKIKKNTFSTLVLELFFPSIANCRKLKIQKIQKSTSPTVMPHTAGDLLVRITDYSLVVTDILMNVFIVNNIR